MYTIEEILSLIGSLEVGGTVPAEFGDAKRPVSIEGLKASLQAEITARNDEAKKHRTNYTQAKKALEEREAQLKSVQGLVGVGDEDVAKKISELMSATTKLVEKDSEIARLQAELQGYTDKLTTLENEAKLAKQEVETTKGSLTERETILADYQTKLKSLERKTMFQDVAPIGGFNVPVLETVFEKIEASAETPVRLAVEKTGEAGQETETVVLVFGEGESVTKKPFKDVAEAEYAPFLNALYVQQQTTTQKPSVTTTLPKLPTGGVTVAQPKQQVADPTRKIMSQYRVPGR